MLKQAWERLRAAGADEHAGYSSGLVEALAGGGPGEPVAGAHVEVRPESWTITGLPRRGKSCKSMLWPEDDQLEFRLPAPPAGGPARIEEDGIPSGVT